jgi:hypothetical protein
VPVGACRRWILRQMMRRVSFRRSAGTFQITYLPHVDQVAPLMFATPAILGVGGLRDRVIAVGGRPEVRPTMILTCSADHKVWDGARADEFLRAIKGLLESEELTREPGAPAPLAAEGKNP